jgi:hypothetical protein
MSRREPPPPPEGMSMEQMVREMYVRVCGDGSKERPGLDIRVDRLETMANIIKWTIGSAILIVATWWLGLFGKK